MKEFQAKVGMKVRLLQSNFNGKVGMIVYINGYYITVKVQEPEPHGIEVYPNEITEISDEDYFIGLI
jgi:hypothetical protein